MEEIKDRLNEGIVVGKFDHFLIIAKNDRTWIVLHAYRYDKEGFLKFQYEDVDYRFKRVFTAPQVDSCWEKGNHVIQELPGLIRTYNIGEIDSTGTPSHLTQNNAEMSPTYREIMNHLSFIIVNKLDFHILSELIERVRIRNLV